MTFGRRSWAFGRCRGAIRAPPRHCSERAGQMHITHIRMRSHFLSLPDPQETTTSSTSTFTTTCPSSLVMCSGLSRSQPSAVPVEDVCLDLISLCVSDQGSASRLRMTLKRFDVRCRPHCRVSARLFVARRPNSSGSCRASRARSLKTRLWRRSLGVERLGAYIGRGSHVDLGALCFRTKRSRSRSQGSATPPWI